MALPCSKYKNIKAYQLNGLHTYLNPQIPFSLGTKVEEMLTLAPKRYTAGLCMVAKVILLWI